MKNKISIDNMKLNIGGISSFSQGPMSSSSVEFLIPEIKRNSEQPAKALYSAISDEHLSNNLYAVRNKRTRQKLQNFFGVGDLAIVEERSVSKLEKFYGVPMNQNSRTEREVENRTSTESETYFDIAVCEINSVDQLLASSFPLVYFLLFCTKEQSAENLIFLSDVEQYNRNGNLDLAKSILDNYFESMAHLELNITENTKKRTIEKFQQGHINAFNEACEEILSLIAAAFSRFKYSEIYQIMISDIGNFSTVRSLEQANNLSNLFQKNNSSSQLPRDKLISEKIHYFVENELQKLKFSNDEILNK